MKTFFLWLVDIITWKSCVQTENSANTQNSSYAFSENKCHDANAKKDCISNGGVCQIDVDGYYIEVLINVAYGIVWFYLARKFVKNLESVPINEWHVLSKVNYEPSEDATREVTPLNDKEDQV